MMKKILMRMLLVGVITICPHLFLNAQPPDGGDPDGDPDRIIVRIHIELAMLHRTMRSIKISE